MSWVALSWWHDCFLCWSFVLIFSNQTGGCRLQQRSARHGLHTVSVLSFILSLVHTDSSVLVLLAFSPHFPMGSVGLFVVCCLLPKCVLHLVISWCFPQLWVLVGSPFFIMDVSISTWLGFHPLPLPRTVRVALFRGASFCLLWLVGAGLGLGCLPWHLLFFSGLLSFSSGLRIACLAACRAWFSWRIPLCGLSRFLCFWFLFEIWFSWSTCPQLLWILGLGDALFPFSCWGFGVSYSCHFFPWGSLVPCFFTPWAGLVLVSLTLSNLVDLLF